MKNDTNVTQPDQFPVFSLPQRIAGRKRDLLCMGSVILEEIIYLKSWPAPGGQQSTPVKAIHFAAGGCALTVACTAGRLGSHAAVISCTGDGRYVDQIDEAIKLAAVDKQFIHRYAGKEGNLVMLLTNETGDWATMDYLDKEIYIKTEDVPASEEFAATKIFHLDGYAYLDSRSHPAVIKAMELAEEAGCVISVDASALAVKNFPAFLNLFAQKADVLFANQDEARAISETQTTAEAVQYFKEQSHKLVFIKLGMDGCIVTFNGKCGTVPAYPVNVVDTIGAGDTMAGCVLHYLSQGEYLLQASRFGNAAGALACRGAGSLSNQFLAADLEAFLAGRMVG